MSILEAKTIQKYSKYSQPELLKLYTKKFNAKIRARDTDDNGNIKCISCPKVYPALGMHAGHYRASTYAATRFDVRNVHGQCPRCNTHLHGNLIEYRINLIKKIGLEEVGAIEELSRSNWKWDSLALIIKLEELKTKP